MNKTYFCKKCNRKMDSEGKYCELCRKKRRKKIFIGLGVGLASAGAVIGAIFLGNKMNKEHDLELLEEKNNDVNPENSLLPVESENPIPVYEEIATDSDSYTDDEGTGFEDDRFQEIMKKIDHFTRNLPKGHHHSQSAVEKAAVFGIELPDDETFVSDFDRKYYQAS